MSDSTKEEAEKPLDSVPIDFADDIDSELATWLNRFDAWQMSMDVTLTVDGFLVSGRPSSFAEYMRSIGESFELGMSKARVVDGDTVEVVELTEAGQAIRENMEAVAKKLDVPTVRTDFPDDASREKAKAEKEARKQELLNTPRQHVFLKRVVILTPSGEYMHQQYWRGRLGHVSGWFFGRPSNMAHESDEL